MKNSTKRIIMSVLTLVLTVVALGTTTFAWFSIGNISTVSGVEGQVQAGDGLEISLVTTTGSGFDTQFKNNLDDSDWDAFMTHIGDNFRFAAVTTTDAINFKELSQRDDAGLGLVELTNGANLKYLEFTINFRSLQPGYVNLTQLEFDGEAKDWTPTGIAPYMQTNNSVGDGTNVVAAAAKNAARISFVHGSNTAVFQEPESAYSLNTSDAIEGNFEQGADVVEHGQWSYLDTRNVYIWTEAPTGGTQITLPSVGQLFAATPTDGDLVATVGNIALSDTAVAGYYNGSVDVKIWIEGWDADTYDAIFDTILKVNMSFQKTTP